MAEAELDCRGLRCPVPLARVSQAIKNLSAGDTLRVVATDPAFGMDVQAWVKRLGHRLVELEDGPVSRAVIEKR
jgi:tRNA 2-thiouridine synthesizing protein A